MGRETFRWVHEPDGNVNELNVDTALAAAEALHSVLRETRTGVGRRLV